MEKLLCDTKHFVVFGKSGFPKQGKKTYIALL